MSSVLKRIAFAVWNGLAPAEGPKALGMTFDFSVNASYHDNFLQENTGGNFQFCQGIYVDNSDNPNPLTVKFSMTQQRIVVPALAQGMWPVMAPDQTDFVISTTPGNDKNGNPLKINVQFLNVPTAYTQWGPITVNSAVTVNASLIPVAAVAADFSSATGAGVSQLLFPANANAKRRTVQNPSQNIDSIFINFGGVAATNAPPSVEITPGSSYDTGSGPIDQTAWAVYSSAVTTFTAKEYV